MRIKPFELERFQSEWEHKVKYNLSESGIHAVSLKDLVRKEEADKLLSLHLGYSQTNGTEELREKISLLYPGSDIDNILVTSGSAEANFISIWSNLEPGDELIFMVPNYMQICGIAESLGIVVKPFNLREELHWAPDLDELRELISDRTKMISICNPNNPTGAILSEGAMDEIVRLAGERGAWILSDEIYRGAELEGERSPSFWGRYEKVLAVSGLSKAYGLPGIRIGWLVGPKDYIRDAWSYHDYSTITVGTINDYLARIALKPEMREDLLCRSKGVLRENLNLLKRWIKKNSDIFNMIPPCAGAMAYVRYNLPINSTDLAMKLKDEKSVLVVPGDCFGMDSFMRIGYGAERNCLLRGLDLFEETTYEIIKCKD